VPPVVDQVNALEHAAPDQPVDAHWLPSQPLTVEMLRRPVESTQFASWVFTQRAKDSGLVPSMGSVGDCYDNAMIEAFWSRIQVELLDRRRWRTRVELANALFEYLEVFHNRQRRHSRLGMLTPLEFENTSTVA
jgi:putative transposase